MSDHVDREIRTAVVELVEASPPPHPAHRVLSSARSGPPLTLRSGLVRMGVVAAAVLMIGLAGAWIGRNLVPDGPAELVPTVEATLGPEPRFDPAEAFGAEEVSLLPPGGELRPQIPVDGERDIGAPSGEVAAVGRVPGTEREVFRWESTDDQICVQVVAVDFDSASCTDEPAGGASPDDVNDGPGVFWTTHADAETGATQVLAVWRVPEESSFVVFVAGEEVMWQRPRGEVVAFAFDSDTPRVILQAFDADRESLASTFFSPRDTVDPVEPGETELEGAPEDLVEIEASNPAVEILEGGATTVESFGQAARDRNLDFSCAGGGVAPSHAICLVGSGDVLVVVPLEGQPGVTARISDPGLVRDVVTPLDRTEPVGVRNLEGSSLEVIIEYYGEEIGSMSAPMLVDRPD